MNKRQVYYCYDAYCGWCYGFSPVITRIADEYKHELDFDVLSGGMILTEEPVHISATSGYIQRAYKTVEDYTGVKFGSDYLWHINNPGESDWYPNSEKPAIALAVFKEYRQNLQVKFAADLQYALHFEGRDLCDDEAYRHLLHKYEIPDNDFYEKLHSDEFKQKAYYEFAMVKQLKVTGYPTAFLQFDETKFYLLNRGYTPYETFKETLDACLREVNV